MRPKGQPNPIKDLNLPLRIIQLLNYDTAERNYVCVVTLGNKSMDENNWRGKGDCPLTTKVQDAFAQNDKTPKR